jgi:hypothetical protein
LESRQRFYNKPTVTIIPTICTVRQRRSAKKPYVSGVDLGTGADQNKKPNDYWSEWQDLNLRPLRPERSALPG